jgi:nitrate/TMAO reductase-like tetraheme cytochrome c subunit
MQSHHESSFRNPLFQAQYFEDLLPRASRDPKLVEEARSCTACHAPVAWSFRRQHFAGTMPVDPSMSGVTCDLCHTITGYDGPEPRNGNFISAPSDRKLGPFPSETNWHHIYSELQTKSEFCATCHEAVNHLGLGVKTTYTEWKKSPFAAQRIQCQDCHMTRDGFLSAGGARFEAGKAAEGSLFSSPVRDRLHTHRFPGAHSRAQVEGAIGVAFSKTPERAKAGQPISFTVSVDNHRTGHKMPTGSVELRLLWLEVTASYGQKSVFVPAKVKALGGYGTAGSGEIDEQLLGKDVRPGSRMYRAVFFDEKSRQTLSSYDALRIVWDNRLDSGEKRLEPYELVVPEDAGGPMRLEAKLVYLSYPTAFARQWEVAPAQPVEVASAVALVEVAPAPIQRAPVSPPPAAAPASGVPKR